MITVEYEIIEKVRLSELKVSMKILKANYPKMRVTEEISNNQVNKHKIVLKFRRSDVTPQQLFLIGVMIAKEVTIIFWKK
jgi:hypothetical protein